jgi:hypothetical protein
VAEAEVLSTVSVTVTARNCAFRRHQRSPASGDAKKMKQLEDENWMLKHVVAELTLDYRALKDVLSKNW